MSLPWDRPVWSRPPLFRGQRSWLVSGHPDRLLWCQLLDCPRPLRKEMGSPEGSVISQLRVRRPAEAQRLHGPALEEFPLRQSQSPEKARQVQGLRCSGRDRIGGPRSRVRTRSRECLEVSRPGQWPQREPGAA